MTGREFADVLIDESGYQLNACLAGVTEETFVAKPLGAMLSIRETFEHLTECCLAVQAVFAEEKFSWGTYRFPAGTMDELIKIFDGERAKAVAIALDNFDSKPDYSKEYLIAHEFYHVGQMVSIRLALNDGFEPYSIYRH